MRNLTIMRVKSFVGCLGKLKIYIEDATSNEITINNIPCRKLGELKSGEEKTFQIDNNAAKVFAIFDKVSKNYCNDFYQLPEGEEDIILTGKNKFNPVNGNAFRFDNNENAEVMGNRKKGNTIGLIVFIVCLLVGFTVGYLIASSLF